MSLLTSRIEMAICCTNSFSTDEDFQIYVTGFNAIIFNNTFYCNTGCLVTVIHYRFLQNNFYTRSLTINTHYLKTFFEMEFLFAKVNVVSSAR